MSVDLQAQLEEVTRQRDAAWEEAESLQEIEALKNAEVAQLHKALEDARNAALDDAMAAVGAMSTRLEEAEALLRRAIITQPLKSVEDDVLAFLARPAKPTERLYSLAEVEAAYRHVHHGESEYVIPQFTAFRAALEGTKP